jgi:hypothetical protein
VRLQKWPQTKQPTWALLHVISLFFFAQQVEYDILKGTVEPMIKSKTTMKIPSCLKIYLSDSKGASGVHDTTIHNKLRNVECDYLTTSDRNKTAKERDDYKD